MTRLFLLLCFVLLTSGCDMPREVASAMPAAQLSGIGPGITRGLGVGRPSSLAPRTRPVRIPTPRGRFADDGRLLPPEGLPGTDRGAGPPSPALEAFIIARRVALARPSLEAPPASISEPLIRKALARARRQVPELADVHPASVGAPYGQGKDVVLLIRTPRFWELRFVADDRRCGSCERPTLVTVIRREEEVIWWGRSTEFLPPGVVSARPVSSDPVAPR